MIPEKKDDYELQERAAIRQYEGNCPQDEAEQLAFVDIKERDIQQKKLLQGPGDCNAEQLKARRDEIARTIQGRSPEECAELIEEWKQLCMNLLELRKGEKR